MTTSRKKRRTNAATTSGGDADSVPGTEDGSISTITKTDVAATGNVMPDVFIGGDLAVNEATKNDDMTTTSGTNAKSIFGIDPESVPITNTIIAASDAMMDVVIGSNTTMDVAIGGDPSVDCATKNDDATTTSSTNAESITSTDATSVTTITNTVVATSNAITDVVKGGDPAVKWARNKNDASTTKLANTTHTAATDNALIATAESVTDAVITEPKSPGGEGTVDGLVQVSVLMSPLFLGTALTLSDYKLF